MSKHYETVLLDVDDDGIATITINRPDKLNALNHQVLNDLDYAITEVNGRNDVHAVIITGAGEKSFVAGADIAELQDLNKLRGTAQSERGQSLFMSVERTNKPVIAVIEGYALGGGCELALACHLRIASEKAIFGLPEVSLGLIPGYGGTQRLTRLIGQGRALEMILTGNHIKADMASSIGLVNRVVPAGSAMMEAREMLKTVLSKGPLAVRSAIKAVMAASKGEDEGYQTEAELFGELCASNDFIEGTTAFLQKRKPEFRGN